MPAGVATRKPAGHERFGGVDVIVMMSGPRYLKLIWDGIRGKVSGTRNDKHPRANRADGITDRSLTCARRSLCHVSQGLKDSSQA
jgi:hypothetical protein